MLAKETRNWLTDIVLLSALFLAFYLAWIGSYPLFTPDEARYSGAAHGMLLTGDFITPKVNGIPFLDKPILYYWLQAASMALFGVQEWAIRLAPTLAALVGCLMTYTCGRLLFDRRTGLIATLVLATSPLYYGGAHYANLDLEVAVWMSCTLLCIITALVKENIRGRFIIAAYVFASLAVLTKGLIGLVFPLMITGLWFILTGRWALLKKLHIGIGTVIMAALIAPWFIAVQHANPHFMHYFFVTQQFSRFLAHGEFNNQSPVWFYIPVVAATFFPWVIFAPAVFVNSMKKCWQDRLANQAALFLLLWFVLVLTFFSIPHSKLVGYIIPVFPPLALLTGRYLSLAWQSTEKSLTYTVSLSFAMLCIILGLLIAITPLYIHSDLVTAAKPTLVALGNMIIAGGTLLIGCMAYLNVRRLTAFCATLSVSLLLIVIANAHVLNTNSAKTLAMTVAQIQQPGDVIVDYHKFHQDVALYLGQRIQLVADWHDPKIADKDNWVREMWLGRYSADAKNILISEKTFWQQWHSDQRVMVLVNDNYLEQFKQHTTHHRVLARANDIYLLVNRE